MILDASSPYAYLVVGLAAGLSFFGVAEGPAAFVVYAYAVFVVGFNGLAILAVAAAFEARGARARLTKNERSHETLPFVAFLVMLIALGFVASGAAMLATYLIAIGLAGILRRRLTHGGL